MSTPNGTTGISRSMAYGSGTTRHAATGAVTFTPAAGFQGRASTTYTIRDEAGRTSNPARIDVTVKPLYGHQQGAEIGYNPQKPGRPSHVYHSYFIANLRISLGVEELKKK